eukprot:522682_1
MSKTMQTKWKHDNTPLKRLYCPDIENQRSSSRMLNELTFSIQHTTYELMFWNQKGKKEPNAIILKKIESESHLEIKQPELNQQFSVDSAQQEYGLSYMRFECNMQTMKLEWQWYDNNDAMYRAFVDDDVVKQLEASFLANVKKQFDPEKYKKKFNNCILTKLKEYFVKQGSSNRDYTFRATFSDKDENDPEWSNVILNMEQISYTSPSSLFPRNIKRMIDRRNSLEFLYRNSFVKTWQIQYMLFTEHQQLYFFAFIVSVVTMMKYIDIEFSNQPVLIP